MAENDRRANDRRRAAEEARRVAQVKRDTEKRAVQRRGDAQREFQQGFSDFTAQQEEDAANRGGGGGGGPVAPPAETPTDVPETTPVPVAPETPSFTPAPEPTKNFNEPGNADLIIRDMLDGYNLGGMFDQVVGWFNEGMSVDEIILKVRQTDEFKARFPAIKFLNDNNLPPMSVDQILAYEQAFRELGVAAGLPTVFYNDHTYIQGMLGDGKSINEITSIVNDVYVEISTADESVKQWAEENYGIFGNNALAAMALDSELATPELLDVAQSILVGGGSNRFGFDLDKERSLELVKKGATEDASNRGFAQLSQSRGLFSETVSEQKDLVAEDEGIGSVLGLEDGTSVQNRIDRRKRAFQGAGGIQSGNQGLTGL